MQGCVARGAVYLSVLMAAAMILIVYVRWFGASEPRNVLMIEGDAAAEGVEVRVDRLTPEPGRVVTFRQTLGPQNGYNVRFFLQPGSYTLTATRSDRPDVIRHDFDFGRNQGRLLNLKGRFPSTRPAAPPPPDRYPAGRT
jgi:hypothetical protein